MKRTILARRVFITLGLSVASILGQVSATPNRFPDCLPEAPRPVTHPGIELPFHLHPKNYPVLAVNADIALIGRRVVASDPEALCRTSMGARKLITVEEEYAKSLNQWLEGNSPVLLKGLGGLLVGAADPVAGTVLEMLTTAFDSIQKDPGFRVRTGDEVWRIDLAGRDKSGPVYVVYTVLNDPFRKQQWLMNEMRVPFRWEGVNQHQQSSQSPSVGTQRDQSDVDDKDAEDDSDELESEDQRR